MRARSPILGALLAALVGPATPAHAQIVAPVEDHARHVAWGPPGTSYASRLSVFHVEPGTPGRLLVTAEHEDLQGAVQAGVVYSLDPPAPGVPAQRSGTLFDGGEVPARRLGRAVGTGDFDGNGLADVVYGGNDRGGAGNVDRGAVFVRWGVADPAGVWQAVATQEDELGGRMGATLSVADLNGDGLDDLVVGDPRAFTGAFDEESRVLIFHGSASLGPASGEDPLPPWPAVTLGEESGVTGDVVSAGADWSCDGRNDLLVGGLSGRLFLLLNPAGDDARDPGWPQDTQVRSADHFWIEILGDLSSPSVEAIPVGDLTGDGCGDVLLGLAEASAGRGEVVLVRGRPQAEWGPSESARSLDELAWIRRRGALPGGLAGSAVQPVQWPAVAGDDLVKPDLLVSAPAAAAAELDGPAGRVLFVPGTAIFGPHGEPVVRDPPGTLPADHPPLEDLSPFLFEGRTLDLALGADLQLWEDIDDDDGLPDVAVAAPGYRLDPEQTTSPEGAVFLIESSTFVDADGDGAAPYEDCDDGDPTVFPGAEEVCNGEDDDCNGVADAGAPGEDTETDADGDGVSPCEGDCDDSVATTHPGAEELCNGVDDDCDGRAEDPEEADDDGRFGDAGCDDGPEPARGCACAVTPEAAPEVAAVGWVLLAMGSLAGRRRRAARGPSN